jgi:riboflavin-specific deaminase-like protein
MSRRFEDRKRMRALRGEADAVLVGASNLRADNPDLALAEPERLGRRSSGKKEPLRIVLTTRGDGLVPGMKFFDPSRGGAAIVVHTAGMPPANRQSLGKVATLVEMGTESVNVTNLLAWMVEDLNVQTLLCEGGGDLSARLFAARAVDALYLTLTPRVLGGIDAPTMVAGAGFSADHLPDAALGALERIGDELFLRYDFTWHNP